MIACLTASIITEQLDSTNNLHSLSGNAIEMLNEQKARLKLNLCQEEIEQILESDIFQQWENRFQEHIAGLKQNGSDLAKFWLTYLELCELLVTLINATRTGNLELYLVLRL